MIFTPKTLKHNYDLYGISDLRRARAEEYWQNKKTSDRVIYTSITKSYDELINYAFIDDSWDYVCFTDNKALIQEGRYAHWQILDLQEKNFSDFLNTRWHKLYPHKLFREHRYSVWIDGNIGLLSDFLFKQVDKLITQKKSIAITRHPTRDCIYEEALACIAHKKDLPAKILEHVRFLAKQGYPKKQGLFENFIIFRKHDNLKCIQTMEDWWSMLCKYSQRDQLSLCYCAWKNGLEIAELLPNPINKFSSKDFSFNYIKHAIA